MPPGPATLILRFDDLPLADRVNAAEELSRELDRRAAEQGLKDKVTISVRRDRSDTQDFGATLVLVLGTPAALAIAKGVHDWIAKRGNRVVIQTEDGTVVATGDGAKNIDVAKAVAAMRGEG